MAEGSISVIEGTKTRNNLVIFAVDIPRALNIQQ